MKQIELTQGQFALVDDEDFEILNKHKWHAAKCNRNDFYARRASGKSLLIMHREILGTKDKSLFVDHIDGNTLNNQRSNLRTATRVQNSQNRKSAFGSSSKYLGVSLHNKKRWKYWVANIRIDKKLKHLGQFPNTEEGEVLAAKLYDLNAIKYFGEFARVNFK